MNDLGFYKGGVPVKGRGAIRGNSLGPIGYYHSPATHNMLDNYHQDSKVITSEDTVKFKHYMNSDKVAFNRTKPISPPYFDKTHFYSEDRRYFFVLLCLFGFCNWISFRWQYEVDRWRMWTRRENITNLPAHHFHNRGGVLIKRAFVGFEKYYVTNDDMMAWYKKAYPASFEEAST